VKSGAPKELPLPSSAQVIADVIGREATLKLAGMLRHNKLYVPMSMCRGHYSQRWGKSRKLTFPGCCCRGHWIVDAIGEELAGKLGKTFAGEILDIAPCYKVVAYERNQRMRQMHEEGASVTELMSVTGLSKRAVFYVIAGWNGRQSTARPRNVASKPSPKPRK
jgi:hypothetical protein